MHAFNQLFYLVGGMHNKVIKAFGYNDHLQIPCNYISLKVIYKYVTQCCPFFGVTKTLFLQGVWQHLWTLKEEFVFGTKIKKSLWDLSGVSYCHKIPNPSNALKEVMTSFLNMCNFDLCKKLKSKVLWKLNFSFPCSTSRYMHCMHATNMIGWVITSGNKSDRCISKSVEICFNKCNVIWCFMNVCLSLQLLRKAESRQKKIKHSFL